MRESPSRSQRCHVPSGPSGDHLPSRPPCSQVSCPLQTPTLSYPWASWPVCRRISHPWRPRVPRSPNHTRDPSLSGPTGLHPEVTETWGPQNRSPKTLYCALETAFLSPTQTPDLLGRPWAFHSSPGQAPTTPGTSDSSENKGEAATPTSPLPDPGLQAHGGQPQQV